jgi:hypothetical protein
MIRKALLLAALLAASALPAGAVPDLRAGRLAGPLTVYPDDRRPGLFYAPPGELELAVDAEGRPDLHLLDLRYTGTVAGGDQGTAVFRSLLTFKVRMAGPTPEELRKAATALKAAGIRRPDLRPLPIRRLESALIYETAGGPEAPPAEPRALPEGHFEAAGAEPGDGTWSERLYTLALDPATADLFGQALRAGQVVLSVGYAFYADGIGPDRPLTELTGSPALIAELRSRLDGPRSETPGEAPEPVLVRAGAAAVTVDAGRWPELLKRVDVNESVPPGYAALDLYCYDFRDALRPGLYEKQVEIEAVAVGGGRAVLAATFRRAEPDLYARSLRFPMAVRLDRPYRFRVIDTFDDGRTAAGPWTDRASWTELLDVTSPAAPSSPPHDSDSSEEPR